MVSASRLAVFDCGNLWDVLFWIWFINKPKIIIIASTQFVNIFFCVLAIVGGIMETLAEQLSILMEKNGLQGIDLAHSTAIDPSTVSRILKGKQMPKADTLYKIAQFFNVSMEYLLTGNCEYATDNETDDEHQLAKYYRQMKTDDKKELLVIAKIKADKIKGQPITSSLSENRNTTSETA